jgi:small basic protein
VTTKLIELAEGILVEAGVPREYAEQISGELAAKVDASLYSVRSILVKFYRPIAATWKEISIDVRIEQAEIELGVTTRFCAPVMAVYFCKKGAA